jgi:hypothetical protein
LCEASYPTEYGSETLPPGGSNFGESRPPGGP